MTERQDCLGAGHNRRTGIYGLLASEKLHSANPIERLNKEVTRRADVVEIFPNEAFITRLIGAVLFEQNDEWQTASRCMQVEAFAQTTRRGQAPFSASKPRPPDHHLRPPNLHHPDGCDPQASRRLF